MRLKRAVLSKQGELPEQLARLPCAQPLSGKVEAAVSRQHLDDGGGGQQEEHNVGCLRHVAQEDVLGNKGLDGLGDVRAL